MSYIRPPYFRRYGVLITLLLAGCLDSYDPPTGDETFNNLVVDGFLNASTKTATIKLSRPQSLSGNQPTAWVRGAKVSISGPSGEVVLNESSPGSYTRSGLSVVIGNEYTLHITTTDGREFYSDPVEALATPPIDSILLGLSNDGTDAEIRLNTRDASGKAQYFSWDYVETYEYTSVYNSGFVWNNGNPLIRRPDQSIWRCWRTIPSTSIGIVTTKELVASVVHEKPIVTIPVGSIKLSIMYSVLISQRVIGEREYNYLRQLKNATENLGGLFDPQPGVVLGNMHEKDNAGNQVLGYFTATELTQKRFFVGWDELPEVLKERPASSCWTEQTCETRPGASTIGCITINDIGAKANVIYALYDARGVPYAYIFTSDDCSDCRTHGGVVNRPSFWPPPN